MASGNTWARWALLWLLLASAGAVPGQDAPPNVGPKVCRECHGAVYDSWQETEHFKGYAELHRRDRTHAIVDIVQGKGSPRKNWACTLCHYTMVSKRGRRARARAGVSCESCHGPGAPWVDVHWDPGPHANHETESAEHKAERLETARERGMVHLGMPYDLAKSCTLCHGLARNDLPAEKLARMFEAGHPIQESFEYVRYLLGSVWHGAQGAEPDEAKRARLLVIGAAAKLVSATEAAGRIDHPTYNAAQRKRIQSARRVLEALPDLPEARALLQAPDDEKARALVTRLETIDVLGAVGGMLPAPSSYK